MSGRIDLTDTHPSRLYHELVSEKAALDRACRTVLNSSAGMFRTAKYAFFTATLGFTTYLIEIASVEPLIAMSFAALLIAGPEAVESWLISVGQMDAAGQPSDPPAPSPDPPASNQSDRTSDTREDTREETRR